MSSTPQNPTDESKRRRRMEIYAFLIITALVMPFVAVATVGTWGLTVWIYQARPARPAIEVRSIVVETPFTRKVDRRKFINGRWITGTADQAPRNS
jgi:nitrate reductase NapE